MCIVTPIVFSIRGEKRESKGDDTKESGWEKG